MQGYIFEVTNNKTGDTYLGKVCAVSFNKNYFGEENNNALAVAIEKYGRPTFSVKMVMPYETVAELDYAFANIQPAPKPKKVVIRETPDKVEDDKMVKTEIKEEVVEAPKKTTRKKKSTKTEE